MSYGNSINPIWMNSALMGGGVDYSRILSDPYFMQLMASQNVSFKGNSSDNSIAASNGASATAAQSVQAGQTAVEGGIPVIQNTASETSGSGVGTTLAVGGALAALITTGVLIKKGKLGKAGEAVRKFFSKGEELMTRPIKTFKLITKDGSELVVKDGKVTSVAERAKSETFKTDADIKAKLGRTDLPYYLDSATGKLAEKTTITRFAQQERATFDGVKEIELSDKNIVSIDSNGVPQRLIIKDTSGSTILNLSTEEAIRRHLTDPKNVSLKDLVQKEIDSILANDKFIIERGAGGKYKVTKIIKNDGTELTGTEIDTYKAGNKEISNKINERIKAIEEGRFDKFNELEEVSFEQRIPDMDATYTKTFDGSQKLVVRGALGKELEETERKAWLHEHNSEYEEALNNLFANGRGEGIERQQFLYTDAEGNKFLVNALSKEIEKITTYERKWWDIFGWANKKAVDITKADSTKYHSWLNDHKSAENEIKEIINSGLGTDSEQTVFQLV